MKYKVAVAGLGLMGASLALALKGFKEAEIVGMDSSPVVCQKALERGIVDRCHTDIQQAAAGADLILFCVYAHHIPALLESCRPALKAGAVLGDICGVKHGLYEKILPMVPETVEYIGLHPMAGRERDGIDNAVADLYSGTGFLICPVKARQQKAVGLVEAMARHIGCARIEVVDYKTHDEIIAYTSDLMHISATALCMRYHPEMNLTFTAGAFRDCTRIADINAAAWSELLLDNRENVLHCLNGFIEDLSAVQQAIEADDSDKLHDLLALGGNNKREMLKK